MLVGGGRTLNLTLGEASGEFGVKNIFFYWGRQHRPHSLNRGKAKRIYSMPGCYWIPLGWAFPWQAAASSSSWQIQSHHDNEKGASAPELGYLCPFYLDLSRTAIKRKDDFNQVTWIPSEPKQATCLNTATESCLPVTCASHLRRNSFKEIL